MLIKINEYVARTGIRKKTLLNMLRSGEAPGRKVGGEWLVLEQDIEPWLHQYMKKEIGGRE